MNEKVKSTKIDSPAPKKMYQKKAVESFPNLNTCAKKEDEHEAIRIQVNEDLFFLTRKYPIIVIHKMAIASVVIDA